ncbi:hypothetical protein GGI25_006491 [Coemansia spiralis]|uniref:Uncharacterized protein n=2 Tax=Coemansia TaxID=4863 RepID=A0A9W8G2M5_9FUNG|nr:hypothetical protein GGI25_006491 [Coemansia spiralis]
MNASLATDPMATMPTEDPGRDEPTSDQLRKIMAQLKDLKKRSVAKAQETAAAAATAKEKCDQVSAKVAAAIKDIKEKGVNEQMAIIKDVKDGQETLEGMIQEIQKTETQMEILMRRRYLDWEDCTRPIGQGQTLQSTNRATGEATSQETETKSAEKAIKAALRDAPKPQRTAEFKTAESSRPKPLTDKGVDKAMKGFGELPNWAKKSGMCIVAVSAKKERAGAKFSVLREKIGKIMAAGVEVYNISKVTDRSLEILLEEDCSLSCYRLYKDGWTVLATPIPCYMATASTHAGEPTPAKTTERWSNKHKNNRSPNTRQYYKELLEAYGRDLQQQAEEAQAKRTAERAAARTNGGQAINYAGAIGVHLATKASNTGQMNQEEADGFIPARRTKAANRGREAESSVSGNTLAKRQHRETQNSFDAFSDYESESEIDSEMQDYTEADRVEKRTTHSHALEHTYYNYNTRNLARKNPGSTAGPRR